MKKELGITVIAFTLGMLANPINVDAQNIHQGQNPSARHTPSHNNRSLEPILQEIYQLVRKGKREDLAGAHPYQVHEFDDPNVDYNIHLIVGVNSDGLYYLKAQLGYLTLVYFSISPYTQLPDYVFVANHAAAKNAGLDGTEQDRQLRDMPDTEDLLRLTKEAVGQKNNDGKIDQALLQKIKDATAKFASQYYPTIVR